MVKKNNNKTKQNTKQKTKQKGGTNVFSAGINLVVQSVDLGASMFTAIGGIMSMPADLKRAVPPPEKRAPAPPAQAPPKKMPEFDRGGIEGSL